MKRRSRTDEPIGRLDGPSFEAKVRALEILYEEVMKKRAREAAERGEEVVDE
jgi:hypothetical protein